MIEIVGVLLTLALGLMALVVGCVAWHLLARVTDSRRATREILDNLSPGEGEG